MGAPVVHFEIIGTDPARLRRYYAELFGWEFGVGDASTEAVSAPGEYGFVDAANNGGGDTALDAGSGINGGVGGGPRYQRRVLFYVGVPDVEAALRAAERLGGVREMGPEGVPGELVVGRFTDPEGNVVGLAGPA